MIRMYTYIYIFFLTGLLENQHQQSSTGSRWGQMPGRGQREGKSLLLANAIDGSIAVNCWRSLGSTFCVCQFLQELNSG